MCIRDRNLSGHSISEAGWSAFLGVLCNTATITDTYLSNHSLNGVGECLTRLPVSISYLLRLNEGWIKNQVARRKILIHHPVLDMGPFLEWDTSSINNTYQPNQSLAILPYVVMWFDRARIHAQEMVAGGKHIEGYDIGEDQIETRKLDATFQFARAVPLMFVPAPKKTGAKRKIGEAS